MISHKHKCIFIHIPKTAGTSINNFFHPGVNFHFKRPDYERLFGWCPKRKIHMQHATAKQLIETELVTENQWQTYYKFTFVRNPWDRAYSDYLWVQDFAKVKGSFKNYINRDKEFKEIFTDTRKNSYLGDHLLPQTDFFDVKGKYMPDFIGHFETFSMDMEIVLEELGIKETFNVFTNKGKRKKDYSLFYTKTKKELVEQVYIRDLNLLGYEFKDGKKGIQKLKNLI